MNEKGINNIKAFMNIIFEKLGEYMKSINDMSTIEKRQNFESDIRTYIEQLINNKDEYKVLENNYNYYNTKMKGNDPHSLIEI